MVWERAMAMGCLRAPKATDAARLLKRALQRCQDAARKWGAEAADPGAAWAQSVEAAIKQAKGSLAEDWMRRLQGWVKQGEPPAEDAWQLYCEEMDQLSEQAKVAEAEAKVARGRSWASWREKALGRGAPTALGRGAPQALRRGNRTRVACANARG